MIFFFVEFIDIFLISGKFPKTQHFVKFSTLRHVSIKIQISSKFVRKFSQIPTKAGAKK
jgi:hypothetical protein